MDPAIRLQTSGLGKEFPERSRGEGPLRALTGIDIEVGECEFVSIIGPSGCGKSTLLNLLAGLDQPSEGAVVLDGRPAAQLLGKVGYMPQADLLMPWRTVLDNAALGLQLDGMKREQARAKASEQFSRFGLAGFEGAWPSQVSGGMRQRAALLRTFLAGGEVLLLDEPFGALDALTRREMQGWLLEIWEQDRKSILCVTHDVEEALILSDRVYVMSGRPGRIETCIDVDLPRPRQIELTTLAARFGQLKGELLARLRGAPPLGGRG